MLLWLTSYVWKRIYAVLNIIYVPPQIPSNAQMKGRMCIEYPFNGSSLEMEKVHILQKSIRVKIQFYICLLFSASPIEKQNPSDPR